MVPFLFFLFVCVSSVYQVMESKMVRNEIKLKFNGRIKLQPTWIRVNNLRPNRLAVSNGLAFEVLKNS